MMTDKTPRLVHGVVTRHEPYGFYIDFGGTQQGVVVITLIDDDPTHPNPPFPPVGSTIEAVLLGYTKIGQQPRLSVRPKDIRAVSET